MKSKVFNVPQSAIEEIVCTALNEDVGTGDVTAQLIPDDEIILATVICREPCILCGMEWFEEVFRQLDKNTFIEWGVYDGDALETNQAICSLSGLAQTILTGERTALNFLQTLSGTATMAAKYAEAVQGTDAIVLDSRKTIPGLRIAQKYAVSCGGCQNHRTGLYDAVLIKENHIKVFGNIKKVIEKARFNNPGLFVEVEVENLDQLEQALATDVDRILLDNFSINELKTAVKTCNKKIPLEASGGITLATIREVAATGVDFISTGLLTKDVKAIDLSMRFS